ncbi:hypothetical protein D0962_00715 [Leptolyngbyaceae cyanobacterium CCMR0082]|uniref:Uncharacterized protein n=1 Tax=Adonisia turfae CCMR0082 TaxID=2304604 RepID=A0A6M0RYL5_9CYAN|nr:hypothetical protein [Adonisia turfae]NEZ61305.1 hypothetical protein [Adonisia turfae CCMR0082]
MSHRRRRNHRREIRTELILIMLLLLRLSLQGMCFALEFIDLQPTDPFVNDSAPERITIKQCPFQIVIPLPPSK